MPDFRPWVAGLLACATFCLPVRAAVDDATRTFAAAKCKYTLPGPDWEWQTPEQKEIIFSAIHESGASITLTAGEVSEGFRLTEKSLANIVGFVEKNSDLKFLGRKRVTVAGVEGYQIDWKRNDGRRSSSRVVCANGRLYHLTVFSPDDRAPDVIPDCVSAWRGFEFVGSPTVAPNALAAPSRGLTTI